jgi:ribosome maturation factor RimP
MVRQAHHEGSERALSKEARIKEIVDPVAEGLGYEIVRVRLLGGKAGTLQIMAERPDGTMTIGGCEELSKAISPVLDIADPIANEYTLEVSSPGIDRPLTRPKDFVRWAGHEAKVELDRALDGRRRFRGVVKGIEGENVLLELTDTHETMKLPFADIGDAKLVLTDELLKLAQPVEAAEFDEVEVEEEASTEH